MRKWTAIGSCLLVALAWGASAGESRAEEISVEASLSTNRAQVGRPLRLAITVTGSRDIEEPSFSIEGIEVQGSGRSVQFRMHNFQTSMITELNYILRPLREGQFTIPPIDVNVEGRAYQTQPLKLNVVGGVAPPAQPSGQPPQGGEEAADSGELAFAEIVVPRAKAFVGETIPTEIRVYFDARIRYQLEGPPQLSSGDFTSKKMPDPRRERRTVNGRAYDVIIFNTALTPIKTGRTEVGPAETTAILEIPVQGGRQSRSLFDDFFNDDFFNRAFGRVQRQRVAIKSDPVDIEVTPLPDDGKPASFEGAVGRFDMDMETNVESAAVGEPVTVNLSISGRGDFDRVGAPTLSEPDGWRTYPPSSDFVPDDTLGISGNKTFQVVLVPERQMEEIPAFEFSYFDPTDEKYITLKSDPVPVDMAAGRAPAPLPNQGSTTDEDQEYSPGKERPAPSEPAASGDILHIQTSLQDGDYSFTPLHRRSGFWMLQAALAAIVLGGFGWALARRRANSEQARSQRERRESMQRMIREMQRDGVTRRDFHQAAVSYLRHAASLHAGRSPNAMDADDVVAALSLSAANVDTVRSVFRSHDELAYSGTGVADTPMPDGERNDALKRIQSIPV